MFKNNSSVEMFFFSSTNFIENKDEFNKTPTNNRFFSGQLNRRKTEITPDTRVHNTCKKSPIQKQMRHATTTSPTYLERDSNKKLCR